MHVQRTGHQQHTLFRIEPFLAQNAGRTVDILPGRAAHRHHTNGLVRHAHVQRHTAHVGRQRIFRCRCNAAHQQQQAPGTAPGLDTGPQPHVAALVQPGLSAVGCFRPAGWHDHRLNPQRLVRRQRLRGQRHITRRDAHAVHVGHVREGGHGRSRPCPQITQRFLRTHDRATETQPRHRLFHPRSQCAPGTRPGRRSCSLRQGHSRLGRGHSRTGCTAGTSRALRTRCALRTFCTCRSLRRTATLYAGAGICHLFLAPGTAAALFRALTMPRPFAVTASRAIRRTLFPLVPGRAPIPRALTGASCRCIALRGHASR